MHGIPDIVNTDQGSQVISRAFTDLLFTGLLFTGLLFTDLLFTGLLFTGLLFTGLLFTGLLFTGLLFTGPHGIRISMADKGSWRGNAFIERLWRSVKY